MERHHFLETQLRDRHSVHSPEVGFSENLPVNQLKVAAVFLVNLNRKEPHRHCSVGNQQHHSQGSPSNQAYSANQRKGLPLHNQVRVAYSDNRNKLNHYLAPVLKTRQTHNSHRLHRYSDLIHNKRSQRQGLLVLTLLHKEVNHNNSSPLCLT